MNLFPERFLSRTSFEMTVLFTKKLTNPWIYSEATLTVLGWRKRPLVLGSN